MNKLGAFVWKMLVSCLSLSRFNLFIYLIIFPLENGKNVSIMMDAVIKLIRAGVHVAAFLAACDYVDFSLSAMLSLLH